MNQLISSLCRGNDVATFSGIEVDPGESLADTAAQSPPISEGRRSSLPQVWTPRVIPGDNQAVGIGRAKVLGKVEKMPSGMGGVNGIVKYTVVDSPGVPPLTPVSLLNQVGAVIDLNSNTMDLKKIETTTTLRTLPSGHVAHKLTEFAPGGWKAPTLEQTELFQVKTDAFRPVTLPGEIKSRSSKQCVGFSSGFVYTVRNQSYPAPSHHQHDPDLCGNDAMSSDLLFDDQSAQRTTRLECSFASGFDVNANSAMGKSCIGRSGSVAKTCSAMPGTRHSSVVANRAGLMATNILQNRIDRVYSFAGTPGPSGQSVVACPRCDRELYVFNTASGPILRCRGWTLAGAPCTLIKACHNEVVIPGGVQNTNRTEGGNSASGSGGSETLPRRDDGVPNPPP